MSPDDVTSLLGRWQQRLTLRAGDPEERGSASLEAAIVVPAVLLVVFTLIQAGMYFNTRNMAARAAATAAVNAAAWQATDADGLAAGQAILDQALPEGQASTITVDRTDAQVVVTVSTDAPSLMESIGITDVTQSAAAPIERWTR